MGRKKTQEEIIQEFQNAHGTRFDYSLVEYKGNNTKVKIICKEHGVFEQRPADHKNGIGCSKCAVSYRQKIFQKTNEQFIQESIKVHGNEYDYSLVDYVNNKTKVKIICKEHGVFEQIPETHLNKNSGCSKCYGNELKTTEQFIQEAKEIHGDKYNYSLVKYVNNTTKVKIICKEHELFEQSPKMHIHSKQGCPECGKNFCRELCKERQIGTEEFIRRSIEVHGNRYDYSLLEYNGIQTKVKIICKEHGVFEQKPNNHLYGKSGCYECGRKLVKGKGGYTIEWIENQPEDIQNQSSLLYVIEMKHKSLKEHFIKIGITTQTIKERFSRSGVGDKYIDKKELFIIPKTLVECIRLENKILEDMKDFRYYPNFLFSGYTECLKPKQEVINYIKELMNE